MNKYNVDLNAVLVKPIYIGLAMNVFFPVAVLVAAYFADRPDLQSAPLQNENLSTLFWILAIVSVVDGAVAIFLKQKLFFMPLITSKENFAEDLAAGTFRSSIVCFAVTTAISVYGMVFYIVGGTFHQLIFFVFISFIAFQLIRPRHDFLKKVIAAQERLVDEGRFFIPQK